MCVVGPLQKLIHDKIGGKQASLLVGMCLIGLRSQTGGGSETCTMWSSLVTQIQRGSHYLRYVLDKSNFGGEIWCIWMMVRTQFLRNNVFERA